MDLFPAQTVTDSDAFDTCATPDPGRPEIAWRPRRPVEGLLKVASLGYLIRNEMQTAAW